MKKFYLFSVLFCLTPNAFSSSCPVYYPGTKKVLKDCQGVIFYFNGNEAYNPRYGNRFSSPNGHEIHNSNNRGMIDTQGNEIVDGDNFNTKFPSGKMHINSDYGKAYYENGSKLLDKTYQGLFAKNGDYSLAKIVHTMDLGDSVTFITRIDEGKIEFKLKAPLGDDRTYIQFSDFCKNCTDFPSHSFWSQVTISEPGF